MRVELSQEETIPLLRLLFPEKPAAQLSQQGSFRGAFTEKGREQSFLIGMWEDPGFNGSSAMLQGEIRCGIFEYGRILLRHDIESARSIIAFRSVDLDKDGKLEILAHSTYEAHNWGATELWVLGASKGGIREWLRRDAATYLMHSDPGREKAWEIAYFAGPIRSKRSYLIRLFTRSMGIGESEGERPWHEIRSRPARTGSKN